MDTHFVGFSEVSVSLLDWHTEMLMSDRVLFIINLWFIYIYIYLENYIFNTFSEGCFLFEAVCLLIVKDIFDTLQIHKPTPRLYFRVVPIPFDMK